MLLTFSPVSLLLDLSISPYSSLAQSCQPRWALASRECTTHYSLCFSSFAFHCAEISLGCDTRSIPRVCVVSKSYCLGVAMKSPGCGLARNSSHSASKLYVMDGEVHMVLLQGGEDQSTSVFAFTVLIRPSVHMACDETTPPRFPYSSIDGVKQSYQ